MTWLILLHAEEILAIILAAVGVVVGIYYAVDNRADLVAYRQRGWNGRAKVMATIGQRNGYAKAGLHAMLIVLPVVSLLAHTPPARQEGAVIFYAALCLGQAIIIGAQVLNQRDRLRLRSELAQQQPR